MYEEKFIRFSRFVEKGLVFVLVCFVLLLVLVQTMLQFDLFRAMISPVDQMEGKLIKQQQEKFTPAWEAGH